MSNIFLTSDLHFKHKNILNFSKHRNELFGDDIVLHNETIIHNWNSKVTKNDRVYLLGDCLFRPNDEISATFFPRLNGEKHLILGNHDGNLRNPEVLKEFKTINQYHSFSYRKMFIVLFHFPIEEWDRKHYGAFHFHGHMHTRYSFSTKTPRFSHLKMDVGIDNSPDFSPFLLDDVISLTS